MIDTKKILSLFSLDSKTAIITGGAGRLGIEHAKILKSAGANVVSFDTAKNSALDGIAEQYIVDITHPKDIKTTVDIIAKKYGGIHVLINNAAINPKVGKDATAADEAMFSPYETYPQTQWDREIAVGLSGTQFCSQAVAPYMMKQKEGSIINISSTSAITAPQHGKYEKGKYKSVAYPTIKTALLGLTRAWASYFAATAPGVRVNSVSFGAVNFGSMEPEFLAKLGARNMIGRPARPDEYQGVILFLASKASEFITASNMVVDGGQTAW